ncbi:restriction endonuclease [Brevibacterium litoralis]|uniref:restriction endonuclease n=1 Tax=Brevibacterium litoralis TaxID=3138935 RepID=UPI0032F00BD9
MPIPAWHEMMRLVLKVLSDGQVQRVKEIRDQVAVLADLTDEELLELTPSGNITTVASRVGWACSYLNRVDALNRPRRSHYEITEIGRKLLAEHPDGITETDLRAIAKPGDEWWLKKARKLRGEADTAGLGQSDLSVPSESVDERLDIGNESPAEGVSDEVDVLTPEEQIGEGVERIHTQVAAELLSRLHANDPSFFEDAVVKLLVAMGYGGADGTATVTRASNDEGIDGIIDQDALGLNRVYVQAKRYRPDRTVQRPEIQAFVGALLGQQADGGVFVTSGTFTSGAKQYAQQVQQRIILVDGPRMADLMIRYGIGVQVKQTFQVVTVDEDFFDDV